MRGGKRKSQGLKKMLEVAYVTVLAHAFSDLHDAQYLNHKPYTSSCVFGSPRHSVLEEVWVILGFPGHVRVLETY